MKRLIVATILLAIALLAITAIAPTPALATPFIPPPGPMHGFITPGATVVNLVDPGTTIEYMVYNPGRLVVSAQHESYTGGGLGPTMYLWAPKDITNLRLHEQGKIEEAILFTGVGSVCTDGERAIVPGMFDGCSTKWDGGGKFAEDWWLLRIYNPTRQLLTIRLRVEGESICIANCGG